MEFLTRRKFVKQAAASAAVTSFLPVLARTASAVSAEPNIKFPTEPRERIAIASYPFRDFIAGSPDQNNTAAGKIDFRDFAAHVLEKFGIRKIEPWSRHFRSTDAKYLEEFRAAVEKAHGAVVDIAVDGDHSIFAADSAERGQAIVFSKQWVDVAAAVGSPNIRTNLAKAKDAKPDAERAAAS